MSDNKSTDNLSAAPGVPPEDDRDWLVNRPIPECIRRIAVPASVGFFFHTMFNVVDTWFAGQIGTTAQAALSLAFPVFFIVIAVGSGVQVGTTALIGNALGARKRGEARQAARQAVLFCLALTVVLTAIGHTGAEPLFRLLGADGDYLGASLAYMLPIFSGTAFFMLIYVFNGILQAVGDTTRFRNVLMVGAVANVGLDPWFIYGGFGLPAMGIAGIAYATLVVQAAGALYMGVKAYQTGLLDTDAPGDWRPRTAPLAEMTRQSIPAGFNSMTIGLGIFIITYFVSNFGRSAVAAYGVATRVEQILLMPSIGLNIATLTLSAQNYGAERLDRVREALDKALLYGAVIMGAGTLVLALGGAPLMRLFSDDPAVVAEGATFLRIAAFLLYAYVLLFVHVAMMQGLKRPMFALWMGLYRQIAAPVALFWLTTVYFDFGVTAIWWCIFAINWSGGIYSFIYARRVLARLTAAQEDGA